MKVAQPEKWEPVFKDFEEKLLWGNLPFKRHAMTSSAENKIERIREAVEKIVPFHMQMNHELQAFAALVLDIVHEDDAQALEALAQAENPAQ